jgi:hypothetical protein
METIKLKVSEIEKDDDIYPRMNISQKTVDAYVESLKCGAEFPPIEVQRIIDNGKERIIALDGIHRTEAHKAAGEKGINAFFWKDEILDKRKNLLELRTESITRNLTHGDRLQEGDKKSMCMKMAWDDPEMKQTYKYFAKLFVVESERTIGNWIDSIRAGQRGTRDGIIGKLKLLGWTDAAIGEVFKLSQSTVNEIIGKSKVAVFDKMHEEWANGKTVDEIVKFFKLDIPTTWAILLDGETSDDKRMEKMEIHKELYNVWNIADRDNRFGVEYPGNTPGQVIANLLSYYTKPGDVVLDPMAGGAVVPDVCLVMGRECKAYDLRWGPKYKDEKFRPEVIQNDILKGLPDMKDVDFIFLDPPYFNIMGDDYPKNAFTESYDGFLNAMDKLIQICIGKLKKGGKIALLLMPVKIPAIGGKWYPLQYECFKIFEKYGLVCIDEILCPTSSQQYSGANVNQAKDKNAMLNCNRSIIVFQKAK